MEGEENEYHQKTNDQTKISESIPVKTVILELNYLTFMRLNKTISGQSLALIPGHI